MSKIKIILATSNPSKKEQIKAILNDSRFEIMTQTEAGVMGEVIENGTTLEENAIKKAFFVQERVFQDGRIWIIADDTGLFINALNGKPGIHSARWAGERATTEDTTTFTLEKLKGATDRSATFKTVVALLSPNKGLFAFEGEVKGCLLEEPQCKAQPKMPYSSIFRPCGSELVWAQMTTEQENSISHRGIAFRKVRDYLLNIE